MPYRRDQVSETERLRRTLVHLETAQRIGHMGSWQTDLDPDHHIYWSPQSRRILGWPESRPEPTLEEFITLLHPDDRDRFVAMRETALAGEGPYAIDYRMVSAEGAIRHLQVAAEIERDPTGSPRRLIGIMRDITDTVALFDELTKAQEARRRLLHQLMHTADAERARLANQLHDGPVQELTAVALRLEHAMREGGQLEAMELALGSLHRVIGSLRTTLFDLHPAARGRAGTRSTLEQLVATSNPGLDASVEVDVSAELDDVTATTVVRIAQEALHNVRKHADASCVEVRVSTIDGHTRLEVSDDGRGFDPAQPTTGGHLGLATMRERTQAAGGELRIRSGSGGTTVVASIPHR